MKNDTAAFIHRNEYKPPLFDVSEVDLTFELDESKTIVRSKLSISRSGEHSEPLRLDGENLELIGLRLGGEKLGNNAYNVGPDYIEIPNVPDRFVIETEVRIDPSSNHTFDGLFLNNGILCTHCEPKGFRRITYSIDRPDVLARYRVEIIADRERFPILLSNGNQSETERLENGLHRTTWEDPHPKPSYLFALAAGNLSHLEDWYTTRSGNKVCLRIYAREEVIDDCAHAMRALQKAFKWEEETYNLEYDLDHFNIVALPDFNFGGMENKSLNVFNERKILASKDLATDFDFANVEKVVAHEYFHNWSGNRVTCQDWFQLSLKEGLTVFRDQQVCADLHGVHAERIASVRQLRSTQFPEDRSSMAHPIRPDSCIEVENFYTPTVYDKGSEVIRMLFCILGDAKYYEGVAEYFRRFDGKAATCDDFVNTLAETSGLDLSQFFLWYSQAGTPHLEVSCAYDEIHESFKLTIEQSCAPTPGQDLKQLFEIPVATALFDQDGVQIEYRRENEDAPTKESILRVTKRRQSFEFLGVKSRPVASVLRRFTAPVTISSDLTNADLTLLATHDTDPYTRWSAMDGLVRRRIEASVLSHGEEKVSECERDLVSAFAATVHDHRVAPSLKAQLLTLPSEAGVAEYLSDCDPVRVQKELQDCARAICEGVSADLWDLVRDHKASQPYVYERSEVDRRSLYWASLSLLSLGNDVDVYDLAYSELKNADNLDDRYNSFLLLCRFDNVHKSKAIAKGFDLWGNNEILLEKWFAGQALSKCADTFDRVKELSQSGMFEFERPNALHALIGSFTRRNLSEFHRHSGESYDYLIDCILRVDGLNPRAASLMTTAFQSAVAFAPSIRRNLRSSLVRLADPDIVSPGVFEIVDRTLGALIELDGVKAQ